MGGGGGSRTYHYLIIITISSLQVGLTSSGTRAPFLLPNLLCNDQRHRFFVIIDDVQQLGVSVVKKFTVFTVFQFFTIYGFFKNQ